MALVLLALAALLAGSALSLPLARFGRVGLATALASQVVACVLCAVAAVRALASGSAVLRLSADWPLPFGRMELALDGLSAWFLLAIALLAAPVALYSWRYLERERALPAAACGSLQGLLVAALIALVLAADAVLFLLAWEAMTFCAFFLVGFHHQEERVRRGAWYYLVATHVGTALFVVPLFAILVARSGDTRVEGFAATLAGLPTAWVVALFFLGVAGFGTKAGFWPLHVWLPHAHPAAPSPVSALLSGVVIKAGIYGLLRLLTWLPPLPPSCGVALLLLGSVTGVLGVLLALTQHDVKRLLAYHSVENIGIIAIGLGMGVLGRATGSPALLALGFAGALLHVLNHALFKGLLFLSAGAVVHATGTGEIDRLGGLARRMPANAALFLTGAVAICGLPPGNGFVSEYLLYAGLFGAAMSAGPGTAACAVLALVALALMGGLALACFSKVFGVVFLGSPRDETIPCRPTPPGMLLAMGLPAAACVLIGAAPLAVVPLLAPALALLAGGPIDLELAAAGLLDPLSTLSALAAVLVGATLLLALARRAAIARAGGVARADVPTWGCGYVAPTPRMSYTGSSFAWPLVLVFRALLAPRREVVRPQGPFPAEASLSTHAVDLAEVDGFIPLFAFVCRLALMAQALSWSGQPERAPAATAEGRAPERAGGPLLAVGESLLAVARKGTVHLHLALVVLTLVVLFAAEACSRHAGAAP